MKWTRKVLHGVVVVATGVSVGLLVLLVIVAWALTMSEENREWVDWALVGLGVVVVAGIACGVWRKISFWALVPALVVCGALLTWLAHDLPKPGPLPESGLVASKNSKSYEVLMWLSKDSPYSRVEERKAALSKTEALRLPADSAVWAKYAADHRDEIALAWLQDGIGREWIDALNRFPPDGVFLDGHKDPLLSFADTRSIFEHRLMWAVSLAAMGRHEEGIVVIDDSFRALGKIQKGGGTLVTQMIAQVLVRRCCSVTTHFLESSDGADIKKTILAETLRSLLPLEQIVDQEFNGEWWYARGTIYDMNAEALIQLLPGFSERTVALIASPVVRPFLYNPHRSYQQYGAFLKEAARRSKIRNTDEQKALVKSGASSTDGAIFTLKNPVGPLLIGMAAPAFVKLADHLWQREDERLALIARLEGR